MTKFRCKNCGFRTESEKNDRRCPYCDRVTLEKEQSAEELLEEAD
jgi:rubrerythrin